MPWWGTVLIAIAGVVVVPFLVWMVTKILTLEKEFSQFRAEFDAKLTARDKECCERLEWLRQMDKKLDKVAENTANIFGLLGGRKGRVRT